MVEEKLQKAGEVIHVIVRHCEDWSKLQVGLTSTKKKTFQDLSYRHMIKMMEHPLTFELKAHGGME